MDLKCRLEQAVENFVSTKAMKTARTDFSWREVIDLIAREEDERAAVLLRQRAERILRTVLHFYCATGFASHFVAHFFARWSVSSDTI